jgi:hypothetical protein
VYLGVDFGLKGALAALNESGNIIDVLPMPLKSDGTIDAFQIYSWLYESWGDYDDEVVACGEKLHAIFRASASSTFNFGKGIGLVTGIIECLEMEYFEVRAVDWQKFHFAGLDEVSFPLKKNQKKPKRNTKYMASKAALRIWEMDNLISYIDKDGIIDALLIAEYARLTQGNKHD